MLLVLWRAGRHRLPAGNRLSIAVCRGMEAGSAHLLASSLQPLLPSHKSGAAVLLHSREQADKQRCVRVCVCTRTGKEEGASKHGFKIFLSPVAVQRNERSASR